MPYKDPVKQREAQRRSEKRLSESRRVAQRERRQVLRDFIISLKKDRPCTDCGHSFHYSAMHWDHLPGHSKLAGVQRMVSLYPSKDLILAEIAKCDLVCANCHAVRSFRRYRGDA